MATPKRPIHHKPSMPLLNPLTIDPAVNSKKILLSAILTFIPLIIGVGLVECDEKTMGARTSVPQTFNTQPKGIYLTRLKREEVSLVKNYFELDDDDDLHSLTHSRLSEVWDWMHRDLRSLWCDYIYREYEYQAFPLDRFVFLHRSHTLFKIDYKVDIISEMLSSDDGQLDVTFIKNITSAAISSYLNALLVYCNHEMITWYRQYSAPFEHENIHNVASYLTSLITIQKTGDILISDFRTWLWMQVLLTDVLRSVANIAYGFLNPNTTLSLLPLPTENKSRTLLDVSHVLLLRSKMVLEERLHWRLLFSTRAHGDSFSTLVKKIIRQGPTIFVMKDHNGCIFGGYVSTSWAISPNFYGDGRCFLFTLYPEINMYHSSGLNDHYMYLNVNQRAMPNGIGMGGQKYFWGLWLDSDFGTGKTENTCSTFFNYKCLSETNEFKIAELEVWGVGGFSPIEEEILNLKQIFQTDQPQTTTRKLASSNPVVDTIRDKDPEAKMLIKMLKE